MTVIVWDGKILAADKQFSWGPVKHQTTKLYIANGIAFGASGDAPLCESLIVWFQNGASDKDLPTSKDETDEACLLVIKPEGAYFYFSGGATPIPIEDTPIVLGTGRQVALGAMHAGANAIEAVRATNAIHSSCGMGIDFIDMSTHPIEIRNSAS